MSSGLQGLTGVKWLRGSEILASFSRTFRERNFQDPSKMKFITGRDDCYALIPQDVYLSVDVFVIPLV